MQTTVLRHCTQAMPSIHPQLAAKTPPQEQSPKQKPAQPLPQLGRSSLFNAAVFPVCFAPDHGRNANIAEGPGRATSGSWSASAVTKKKTPRLESSRGAFRLLQISPVIPAAVD
jgi:hypothetical protein